MLKVDRHNPRGESPGEKMKVEIEKGGVQGWRLVQILPLFDEILLVWDKPSVEKRGAQ